MPVAANGRRKMAGPQKTEATHRFWQEFCGAAGIQVDDYDVVSFGDDPATATELADLVVAGQKRATAGLLRQFGSEGEPPPIVGGYVVLVDGEARPRAVWRTTALRVGPLASVDQQFAWDEGEGERTREWWLSAHRSFFGRQADVHGFQMHDEIETVFERFEVLWPSEIADRR
jgi:uncharacterized protein YhfF